MSGRSVLTVFGWLLEMETDAEHEFANGAELGFVAVEGGVDKLASLVYLLNGEAVDFGSLLVVGDAVFAEAIVIDASAYVATEEAACANLPCEGVLYVVAEGAVVDLLAADEEEVGAETKFSEGLEYIGELVAVVDTEEDGDVEIGRSLCVGIGGSVSVAVGGFNLVPLEVDVGKGSNLAKSYVEEVAGTTTKAEACGCGGTDIVLGEERRGSTIVSLTTKLSGGEAEVEINGTLELCIRIYAHSEHNDCDA